MRKICLFVCLLLLVPAALGGCGGGKPEKVEAPTQIVPPPQDKPAPPLNAQ
jgi:hypothetical protein